MSKNQSPLQRERDRTQELIDGIAHKRSHTGEVKKKQAAL